MQNKYINFGVVVGKFNKRLHPYILKNLKLNEIHSSFGLVSSVNIKLESSLKWTCMFCLTKHKTDVKNCSICGSSASSSSLTLDNQKKQEKQSFIFNKSKFDYDFFSRDEGGGIAPIKKFLKRQDQQQPPELFKFNDKQENGADLKILARSTEQDMKILCSKWYYATLKTPIKPVNDFNRKFNCIYYDIYYYSLSIKSIFLLNFRSISE